MDAEQQQCVGGWGGEERESNTKSWSEGGGEWAVFMVQHTD